MLKSAVIALHNRSSVFDCVVRDMNESGARIRTDAAPGMPETFLFRIRNNEQERHARIVWQGKGEMGLKFST